MIPILRDSKIERKIFFARLRSKIFAKEALINSHYAEVGQRTETLRKCVRSEETCPKGASEAYFRTVEKPLGQRFAGDGVFYQRFPKMFHVEQIETFHVELFISARRVKNFYATKTVKTCIIPL